MKYLKNLVALDKINYKLLSMIIDVTYNNIPCILFMNDDRVLGLLKLVIKWLRFRFTDNALSYDYVSGLRKLVIRWSDFGVLVYWNSSSDERRRDFSPSLGLAPGFWVPVPPFFSLKTFTLKFYPQDIN